jgi:hypothetical protein
LQGNSSDESAKKEDDSKLKKKLNRELYVSHSRDVRLSIII